MLYKENMKVRHDTKKNRPTERGLLIYHLTSVLSTEKTVIISRGGGQVQIFSGVNFISEKDGLCVNRELQ